MNDLLALPAAPYHLLAERFGTPLYVYDAHRLEASFAAAQQVVGPDTPIYFSLKANPNISIYAVLRAAGARAEVSSLAELTTVLRAGTPAEDILFLGPGKSEKEIRVCLAHGVRLVVESLSELDVIDLAAAGMGVRAAVLLRVNPSFQVKGSGLTMGGAPRQFGIDEEILLRPLNLRRRWSAVRVVGVHAYMGTRMLAAPSIIANTHQILALATRIAAVQGFEPELIDVGGGWGVPYFEGESPLDLAELEVGMRAVLADFRRDHPHTTVATELGRFLTGPSGVYVTRVRWVKTSLGQRFAVTDGGTNHHMAAVGIGSFVKRNFPVEVLGRDVAVAAAVDDEELEEWTVTGPLCTPNDTLVRKVLLPPLAPGDLLGIRQSGAYGPSASPGHFLSHGFPAEVLVRGDRADLIAEPETTTQILARQILSPLAAPAPVAR